MSALLTGNLPLIADAPEGIRKLRGLILELAVRGKLVPQDEGDEPASALLRRIADEAREKGLSLRTPELDYDSPFELPSGWTWAPFGAFAQHNSGKTLDKGRNTGTTRKYITTSNLYWGRFQLENIREMPIQDSELDRCTARKNDLLICEGGEAGRAAVWDSDEEICFQNHVHRARFLGEISPYYIYRTLQKMDLSGEINKYRKGVGISNLSGKALSSIPISLPPLAEQHRIVAKVDELMALCDRLEAEQADAEAAHARLVDALLTALARSTDAADFAAHWQRLAAHFDTLFTTEAAIDALKQTVLQLAVMGKLVPQDPNDEPASELLKRIAKERARLEAEGACKKSKSLPPVTADERPFEVPKSWVWSRLGEISVTSTGKTPSTTKPEYYGGSIPFVGPGQLTLNGQILPSEKTLSEIALSETSVTDVEDILMVCIGGSIGKCAIASCKLAFNQQINCAKILLCNPRFAYVAMTSRDFQKTVRSSSTGSATPIINKSKWDEIHLPIPPVAEQHRIVAKVDELMALCDRLKADLATARQRQATLADTLIAAALEAA